MWDGGKCGPVAQRLSSGSSCFAAGNSTLTKVWSCRGLAKVEVHVLLRSETGFKTQMKHLNTENSKSVLDILLLALIDLLGCDSAKK